MASARPDAALVRRAEGEPAWSVVRRTDNFGFVELDLAGGPGRFWGDDARTEALLEQRVDAARVDVVPTPSERLRTLAEGTMQAAGRSSQAALLSWFLLAEDPHRRLDVRPVVTLAHQMSLVQHVLARSDRRMFIADEVGLGKTVEAGLIIRSLRERQPGLRVLYLAPARLVSNVRVEMERLGLPFRQWSSAGTADGHLDDGLLVASIHRAVHPTHFDKVVDSGPWDVLIVDECHHLSAWSPDGGDPVQKYQLVARLVERLAGDAWLFLLSGTPHQGHAERFRNLLSLLRRPGDSPDAARGRVVYRTKEDVLDWNGEPLFPRREVRAPKVLPPSPRHLDWLENIHALFVPEPDANTRRRAAVWRCLQALQWASSSVEAGLGYLVRQAIRAGWDCGRAAMHDAVGALRPYRGGAPNEPVEDLYRRLAREVERQRLDASVEDIEEDEERWRPDPVLLDVLLRSGVLLKTEEGDRKWRFIEDRILSDAGEEKVVFFAQPIETVGSLAAWLERRFGEAPALIIGGQDDAERRKQVEAFWRPDGPRFLVSSKAGGEGINLQVARRVVHVDVPWNPMDLEQRVGRVHRFGSRQTIVVETVVLGQSREVDAFRVAREKLQTITSSLVQPERFEALFSRVMALVAPEDLQSVMGAAALAPLSEHDASRLAELVSEGFQQWQRFHEEYRKEAERIRRLDPGQAGWDDLARFVAEHLRSKELPDFELSQLRWRDGEIVEQRNRVSAFEVDGDAWVCRDTLGMPVIGPAGRRAKTMGLNLPVVARKLRELGLQASEAGPAHLRRSTSKAGAMVLPDGPCGVIVVAKQSFRSDGPNISELRTRLTSVLMHGDRVVRMEGDELGTLIRTALDATPRRQLAPDERKRTEGLLAALVAQETALMDALRRPTETERAERVFHAARPIFSAVIW